MSNISKSNVGITFMEKFKTTSIDKKITLYDILNYFTEQKLFRLKDFDTSFTETHLDELTYENIICHRVESEEPNKYKYYRFIYYKKSVNKIILKEIYDSVKEIIHWSDSDLPIKEFDLDIDGINLCILSSPVETLNPCDDKVLYHGSGYRMPKKSDRNPYNKYGNWYSYAPSTMPFNQTEAYTYLSKDISYFYTYKLKKTIKAYNADCDDEGSDFDNYIFLFIMFFDIVIGFYETGNVDIVNTRQDEHNKNNKVLLFFNTHTKRDATGVIKKYNYTIYENLINTKGEKIEFENNKFQIIKSNNGDGDKPLAAKMCSVFTDDKMPEKHIGTWLLSAKGPRSPEKHFMCCNPLNGLVKNISAKIIIKENFLSTSGGRILDFFHTNKNVYSEINPVTKTPQGDMVITVDKTNYKKFNLSIRTNLPEIKFSLINNLQKSDPSVEEIKKKTIENKYKNDIVTDIFIKIKKILNLEYFEYLYMNDDIKKNDTYAKYIFSNLKEFSELLQIKDDTLDTKVATYIELYIGNLINFLKLYIKKDIYFLDDDNSEETKEIDKEINKSAKEKINDKVKDELKNYIKTEIDRLSEQLKKLDEVDTKCISNIHSIDEVKIGGNYKEKYLKYKQKYLQLKKNI